MGRFGRLARQAAGLWIGAHAGVLLAAAPAAPGPLGRILGACEGDCALAVYAGAYVDDSMQQVLLTDPEGPFTWDYREDFLLAGALSRRVARLFGRWDLEAEAGLAKRFGKQSEFEIWGAAFLRYRGFPWDRRLVTSIAFSTGLDFATGISEVERDRARDGEGSRVMHFFSPEITFALPSNPDRELVFRFHHRSGVFGLISEAHGGAQYGSIGLRWRF